MRAIVITGTIGCGNSTVAELLARKLGIKHFSLGKHFKSMGRGEKETDKGINYAKTSEGRNKKFHKSLDNMQEEMARRGDIVIDSKLGIHFLKNHARTIWLTAPEKTRAERICKREGWDFKKSLKKLREKESLEKELFKEIYGIDYMEQKNKAEIVVNTEGKTPDEIVSEIVKKLNLGKNI